MVLLCFPLLGITLIIRYMLWDKKKKKKKKGRHTSSLGETDFHCKYSEHVNLNNLALFILKNFFFLGSVHIPLRLI